LKLDHVETTPHPDFIGELPYQGANFSPNRGSARRARGFFSPDRGRWPKARGGVKKPPKFLKEDFAQCFMLRN